MAFYIWSSYAITAITFIGLFVMFKMQRNQLINQIRKRYRQQAGLRKNTTLNTENKNETLT